MPQNPYDEQQGIAFQQDVIAAYTEAGRAPDLANVVWSNRMTYDAVTQGYPLARARHLAELRRQLGINPNMPTEAQLRNFSGNLCGMFFPGLQYPLIRPGLLFTPGYVVENDFNRARILDQYEGSHFVVNLTNHSTIYRDYYPNWDDTLINKYLTEILKAGKLPVGVVMGDRDKEVQTNADPSLVSIVLPKWEDATPFTGVNTFKLVKNAFPNSLMAWHNPPNQDAPYNSNGWDNATVWNKMNEWGVSIFLFQGQAWNDPANSIANLQDFVPRLKDGFHGYPHPLTIVDFEETAYYMMNLNGSIKQSKMWTKQIREAIPRLDGFCNG
jgi:hypothetical protein